MKPSMDSVLLEIYRSLYSSVAEEMGVTLRRTSFSPNIKERRDYSCAVFDRLGRVIAQGDHMPVHLGSMPMSVQAAISKCDLDSGAVIILNHPYAGGTHLPDVTMVAPVVNPEAKVFRPLFYVANRAHHADIGGSTPGSMGAASEIYHEGLRIPPVHLVTRGKPNEELLRLLLANVRGHDERRGDLAAQLGALRTGESRLMQIVSRYGFREADRYAQYLIECASRLARQTIAGIPDGVYEAEDFLDSDGLSDARVRVHVTIVIAGDHARVDFTGSSSQVAGAINAVEAITFSAVYYVIRCLIQNDVPASAGIMEPVEVVAPLGTVVNATPPAAVAGGNVETSQRIVDVLFKALAQAIPDRVPAASQGTMNNLTIGGWDDQRDREFAYYETIAGGMGARPHADGLSGVHTHMTNSLNTPVEALEYAYPLRIHSYSIRRNSGGEGQFRGGEGVIREIELLAKAQVSMLADRREIGPYGLAGGEEGKKGRSSIRSGRTVKRLAGKFSLVAEAGDRIRIETPGGGGYGEVSRRARKAKKRT